MKTIGCGPLLRADVYPDGNVFIYFLNRPYEKFLVEKSNIMDLQGLATMLITPHFVTFEVKS
jgi:hypothetical protein